MADYSFSNVSSMSTQACHINSSHYPVFFKCAARNNNSLVLISSLVVFYILLILPMCIVIFWMGFAQQRRRKKNDTVELASHTDVFTQCMAVADLSFFLGLSAYLGTEFTCSMELLKFAYYCLMLSYSAQSYFHFLTSIERYLAVVHPITYMRLRGPLGVGIRNSLIGCAFLLSFLIMGVGILTFPIFPGNLISVGLAVALVVASFCTFSAFLALRHPGVGKDKHKKRAFNTLLAITAVLLVRSVGQCYSTYVLSTEETDRSDYCEAFLSGCWMITPSALVLPVLFLHKRQALKRIWHHFYSAEN